MNDALKLAIPGILPCLMVLIGILLNKNDSNRLGSEIRDVRSEVASLRTSTETGLRVVRGEISSLRASTHSDLKEFDRLGRSQDTRITLIEDKMTPIG